MLDDIFELIGDIVSSVQSRTAPQTAQPPVYGRQPVQQPMYGQQPVQQPMYGQPPVQQPVHGQREIPLMMPDAPEPVATVEPEPKKKPAHTARQPALNARTAAQAMVWSEIIGPRRAQTLREKRRRQYLGK